MKICIKNCILISMDEKREKVEENVDILIDNNKIKLIGKNLEVNEEVKCIDAKGKVVMPGLINTHSHVPMSIFRETLDGYNLQDWLTQKIWPMEDKLTEEDIFYASYLSFIEMVKTGTTTINDMYAMTEEIIKAMEEVGIRLQTTRTLMNAAGDEDGKARIEEFKEIIRKYNNKHDRLTLNVGIHGMYTADGKYIDECIKLAKENNLIVHIHFCENSKEVEDIKNLQKDIPINVLKSKFKDVKTVLAHCVKLSTDDIKELKNMNVSISHCPISNLKLGCGIAKINEMLDNGINVSLGTDGQGSGSNLDLFETMKFTALLQKGVLENPKSIPAYEVLKMATVNGAKALGLEEKIGSITEGKLADIIIIDIDDIKVKPVNDLISEIVYNVNGNNVITTIVDGKILMQDRKVIFDKENEICEKCEAIIKRIQE